MTVYKFSNVSGFKNYQKYNDFLAGNPAVILDKGSMYPLGVFTLASSQASIEFTNIPQTYTHLQLRGIFRSTNADTGDHNVVAAFNSDTTNTNYRIHVLEGDGATASSGNAQLSGFYGAVGLAPGNNSTSNTFGTSVVDILDYRNTNKNTTIRTLTGDDKNGSGYARLASTLWTNTAAITTITISLRNAGNFTANSSFALYGVLA